MDVKKVSILLVSAVLACAPLVGADLETLRKAPDFNFTIPGEGQKTLSQYHGKVVALEFIFTTCPHCQAASKMMGKLQQEYGPRGLQVIDVAVNPNADLLVENFIKDFQVAFPVGWAPSAQMTSFMGFPPDRYVVPQLVLMDRKGYIHYQTPATEDAKWDNLMKEETIRQNIEHLLGAGSSAARHPDSSRRTAAKAGS